MLKSSEELEEQGLELLGIAERFYDAVTDPRAWVDACAALTARFGGATATLFLDRSSAGIVPIAFPGFSDTALRLFAEHYNKVDPWSLATRQRRPAPNETLCFLGHDVISAAKFEESEVWQDYSRLHVGAFHLIGSSFTMDDGSQAIMGLHRQRDASAYEPADVRRLRLLLPHLRNALFLAHRLETAESLAKVGFAALEHIASGIAIIDRARKVVFANSALERLVAAGGLHLRPEVGAARLDRGTHLSLAHPTDQARFIDLVEQAARRGAGGAMRIGQTEGDRRLVLLAMPLPHRLSPRSSSGGILDSGKVLVIVRDHSHPGALRGEVLKALYGLTDAEVAVAQALLGGRNPESVAAERGVSMPTIRTQVRYILDKAGVRSLRELEGLLLAP